MGLMRLGCSNGQKQFAAAVQVAEKERDFAACEWEYKERIDEYRPRVDIKVY
jgi:hypothetical protein